MGDDTTQMRGGLTGNQTVHIGKMLDPINREVATLAAKLEVMHDDLRDHKSDIHEKAGAVRKRVTTIETKLRIKAPQESGDPNGVGLVWKALAGTITMIGTGVVAWLSGIFGGAPPS